MHAALLAMPARRGKISTGYIDTWRLRRGHLVTANLTRDEARTRAELIKVRSYRVELDLTGGDTTFRSISTVAFDCARPGSGTFLNLEAPQVHSITLNGAPVPLTAFDGERITLDGLAAENTLVVDAECAYSRSGEGLHRFADPADGNVYMYSDLETFDAHRVYACFDQPDMKARYELTVRAPQEWMVVSNMAADVEGGTPDGAGVRRWHFPPTPLMATYITHVSAGPWHVVRDEHDGIPLGIFCRQSLARYLDPDEIFEVTRQGFDFYHQAFGIKYPFGKYDQLFVPEFKEGAMENAGAVTFLEDYVFRSRVTDFSREARGETILHEMAHMWFGDLVTMRWWDDLWLNESFATWAGTAAQAEATAGRRAQAEATRWTHAWTTFTTAWKAWAYKQDQLPSTHPIAADIPDIHAVEVNFDGITYAKGAAVLKQLVAYVGRENFLAGVRQYFAEHSFGNATLADLLAALEDVSGRDLAAWSREWLETAGVNTLRPSYTRRRRRPLHLLLGGAGGGAIAPGAALAPHRDRPLLAGGRRPHPDHGDRDRRVRSGHRRAGTDRAAPARPGAGQRRGPHLRQDPARRRTRCGPRSPRSARSPRRCPPPWSGRPAGTCAGTGRWPRGTTSGWCSAGWTRCATSASCRRCCGRRHWRCGTTPSLPGATRASR